MDKNEKETYENNTHIHIPSHHLTVLTNVVNEKHTLTYGELAIIVISELNISIKDFNVILMFAIDNNKVQHSLRTNIISKNGS